MVLERTHHLHSTFRECLWSPQEFLLNSNSSTTLHGLSWPSLVPRRLVTPLTIGETVTPITRLCATTLHESFQRTNRLHTPLINHSVLSLPQLEPKLILVFVHQLLALDSCHSRLACLLVFSVAVAGNCPQTVRQHCVGQLVLFAAGSWLS